MNLTLNDRKDGSSIEVRSARSPLMVQQQWQELEEASGVDMSLVKNLSPSSWSADWRRIVSKTVSGHWNCDAHQFWGRRQQLQQQVGQPTDLWSHSTVVGRQNYCQSGPADWLAFLAVETDDVRIGTGPDDVGQRRNERGYSACSMARRMLDAVASGNVFELPSTDCYRCPPMNRPTVQTSYCFPKITSDGSMSDCHRRLLSGRPFSCLPAPRRRLQWKDGDPDAGRGGDHYEQQVMRPHWNSVSHAVEPQGWCQRWMMMTYQLPRPVPSK